MALDIVSTISEMVAGNVFTDQVNNVRAQFGTKRKRYLGATLMPEQPQNRNMYEENGIRYRSIIANDGTRYSPVQLKKGMLVGSFEVRLGYQDIGTQMTARDYDAFVQMMQSATTTTGGPGMQAMFSLLNFTNTQVNIPLREKIEKQRWEVMLKAMVERRGDNGYKETVNVSNPAGHRVNASDWTDETVDPYDDIIERVEFLKSKGYTCNRIITDFSSLNLLLRHPKIRQRLGILVIIGGTSVGMPGRVTAAQLNDKLAEDNIPPIETYDEVFQTDTGFDYFFERGNMWFGATTGRDEQLILGPDQAPIVVPDTFGYVGVGTPVGVTTPRRVIHVRAKMDTKPPGIESEGWQASFPVLTEPEAVAVLNNIGGV